MKMPISIEGLLDRIGLKRENRVGIAFSGGGARGFAHIGVLKAMEEHGIHPDVISGVSAGSVAAALYGAGLTPAEMAECFAEATRFGDFTEWSLPRKGFMKLDRFAHLLESWLPVKRLEEMKIPTVICATDFDHGKSVGWGKGEIVPRVIASCSIPIVFEPVRINGVNFVDGGVLRNLPAWAIRDYCKTLYGSNCSPMQRESKAIGSILDVAYRTFHIMLKSNTPQDVRLCDHVITINELLNVKTFDLKSMRRAIEAGYSAANQVLDAMPQH